MKLSALSLLWISPHLYCDDPAFALAFIVGHSNSAVLATSGSFSSLRSRFTMKTKWLELRAASLGDFTVQLEKPLGIVLEERESGADGGVQVKEIGPEGSAASSRIVPGDVLLQVNDTPVEDSEFDTVMDLIISSPSSLVSLTVGDGLGNFDMPKNVVKALKSKEDAYFIDAVVREAVREVRRNGRLGDLTKVEVIVGAGVQGDGKIGMVRFFAIFSTDGVSTYSCNVASKGIRQEDGSIKIISLSCAKDEGLGQTIDLI